MQFTLKNVFCACVGIAMLFTACGEDSTSSKPSDDESEYSLSSSSDDDDSSSSEKKSKSSSSISNDSGKTSSASGKSSSGTVISSSSSKNVAMSSALHNPDDYLNPDINYGTLTDPRDGQTYKTVKIGIQTWMAQNLNLKTDSSKESKFSCGKLYPWSEAVNIKTAFAKKYCGLTSKLNYQGICPDGWHLPAEHDWNILKKYIVKQGYKDIGPALRSKNADAWPGENDATDVFGFSLVAGGWISYAGVHVTNNGTSFWLPEESGPSAVSTEYGKDVTFGTLGFGTSSNFKKASLFVRCIEDYDIDEEAKPAPKEGSIYDSIANTLTDLRDNKVYKTTQIVDQIWMAENLKYVTEGGYADMGIGTKYTISGGIESYFYRWNSAMDIPNGNFNETYESTPKHQGICPIGWHIPTVAEFDHLYKNLGENVYAFIPDTLWSTKNALRTNFHFDLQPVGYYIDCGFENFSYHAGLWTADNQSDSAQAYLYYYSLGGNSLNKRGINKHHYLSVRCLRDQPAVINEFRDFGSLTDPRDYKTYKTTKIGDDIWMAENLNYIDTTTLLKEESFCFDKKDSNCTIFGRLYTWNAATLNGTEQGVCPDGWHVSSREDWNNLEANTVDRKELGYHLKSSGMWNRHEYPPNTYGFSAIPSGYYSNKTFWGSGYQADYWSNQEFNDSTAFFYSVSNDSDVLSIYAKGKSVARAVRCVKNKE